MSCLQITDSFSAGRAISLLAYPSRIVIPPKALLLNRVVKRLAPNLDEWVGALLWTDVIHSSNRQTVNAMGTSQIAWPFWMGKSNELFSCALLAAHICATLPQGITLLWSLGLSTSSFIPLTHWRSEKFDAVRFWSCKITADLLSRSSIINLQYQCLML